MKRLLVIACFGVAVLALILVTLPPAEFAPPTLATLDRRDLPKPAILGGVIKDPDSLSVIQKLLSLFPVDPARPSHMGLLTERWDAIRIGDRFPPDWSSAVQGVRDVNRFVWRLDSQWTPASGWKQLEPDHAFHDRVEQNIRLATLVLPPGFNPEKTRALLYYEQVGITDCCGGWLAFEKTAGKWELAVPKGMELVAASLR
jgi:hypothetical protein